MVVSNKLPPPHSRNLFLSDVMDLNEAEIKKTTGKCQSSDQSTRQIPNTMAGGMGYWPGDHV
jgi:hypothetical protein